MVQDRARTDLDRDRLISLALVRLLEIFGEAAGRVTSATQELHPEIAWGWIIALRNRLIHAYDPLNRDIVWQIASRDLTRLIAQPEGILSDGAS